MVHSGKESQPTIPRRRLLQGLGAAGAVSIAGCFGDDGDEVSFPLQVTFEVDADQADRVEWTQLIAQLWENTGYFEVDVQTHASDDYTNRIFDPAYPENGYVAFLGLSGTYNPESFVDALHGTANQGQCCNVNGLGYDELDEMIDQARFSTDVVEDDALRRERYDEIWPEVQEYAGSSIIHFVEDVWIHSTDVHGFEPTPFVETSLSYALHSPQDEVVTWLDENNTSGETDLSDLQEGGTLHYGLDANIDSFDPPYSLDVRSTFAQELLFEQLVATDFEGNLYPWLAERWEVLDVNDIDRSAYEDYMESVPVEDGAIATDEQVLLQHPEDSPGEDDEVRVLTPETVDDAIDDGVFGMQIRYDLHEGIEFHDGEEFTAENVVLTMERYYNSQLEAQTFDSLLHAVAVDEYTVDLYAQVPDAEAERELPGLYIHSSAQAELPGGDLDPREGTDPVGTGPYVFEEFEDESYYVVTKNDDYWLEDLGLDALEWWDGPEEFPAGPVIDEIDVDIVPEDSTRSGALQTGELHVTEGVPMDDLDDYEADDDFVVNTVTTGLYQFLQYPVQVEPFDDERLRQAVNHLIPREQIVDEIINGYGQPAWVMLPEFARETGSADYDALVEELREYNEFDEERAIELIEEVIEDRGYESSV